ncbi:ATP-binding protein [Blastopirellula sp. J2-11]|uniref:ATP-binding protein n=1 Tax=Blastopirellula sp. J2-11 TaxID=2943192 RepID=UPI0021C5E5FA|nr:ATP-binding protein [Blastopirellula sp. J2-11]UUO06103.1 ATP-binding protein [Blastopirellula sp. J2-11]
MSFFINSLHLILLFVALVAALSLFLAIAYRGRWSIASPLRLAVLQRRQRRDRKRRQEHIIALRKTTEAVNSAKRQSQRKSELLTFVTQLQKSYISGDNPLQLSEQLLQFVLDFTESKFGFVGEVVLTEAGLSHLRVDSIANIAWNAETRLLQESQMKKDFDSGSLHNLFVAAIHRCEIVTSNSPATDSRLGELPPGHPPLTSFLGLPLISGESVVGMIGVANRSRGYDEALINELRPLLTTVAQLIVAMKNERSRLATEERLWDTLDELVEQRSRVQEYAAELEVKNHELEESRRRAEASNLAKSEFLANMSHEIRTPMTAVLGFADVLLEDGDIQKAPKSRVDVIRTIQRNGMHLLGLINDILDVSKIEAGKLSVEQVKCRPAAIIKEVLSLMQVRAEQSQVELKLRYESETPQEIISDPTRMRQILMNLIGNAIKFTEEGSVTLAVRFIDSPERPMLEFDVIDTGIGMTLEHQQLLFQPFSQADSSMSRRFGGSGLGLAISLRLAGLLGGEVSLVQSTPETGSTFRFRVGVGVLESPAMVGPQDACDESNGRILSVANANAPNCLQGCRILVAEDGPDNQRLIRYFLEKAGAAVTMVENGQLAIDAALDALREKEPFHVILTDIQMPVVDGYEATARLRAAGYTGRIVALTAHAMEGERAKCLEAGCDDFASKPIQRVHLISQIESHFHAAREHAQQS